MRLRDEGSMSAASVVYGQERESYHAKLILPLISARRLIFFLINMPMNAPRHHRCYTSLQIGRDGQENASFSSCRHAFAPLLVGFNYFAVSLTYGAYMELRFRIRHDF